MGLPTSFVNKNAAASTTSTGAVVTVFTHSSALKNPDGSAGNGGVLDRLVVYNSDTIQHTVQLYRVPIGSSAGSTNLIESMLLPTLTPYIYEGPLYSGSGDFYAFRLSEPASSSYGVVVQAHYHEMS